MTEEAITQLRAGAMFHDRYRVVRRIAAGGMGAVYEAVDDRTDSPRALKVMLPSLLSDPDLRARFTLEAKITGNISSDHIVRVSDAGIDEATQTPFLVMELLRGENLDRVQQKRGPLPPAEVVLYLHQAALALDKTHAAGIVHRDLKPENLFVTYRDDGSPCVKILDFGIAKVVARSAARMTRAVGTPMFMAPEQIQGEASIGAPADLFALGHIAYTLLTGEPYWNQEMDGADSVFTLLARMMTGMPETPNARALRRRGIVLPPAFNGWMQRAVAWSQEDRFDRATVQIAALAEALGVAGARAPLPSLGVLPLPLASGSRPPPYPGSSSDARPAGTAAAVVREAVVARSALPLAVVGVLLGMLGVGGGVALFVHFTAPGASSTSPGARVEPPPAIMSAEPPSVVAVEPSVAASAAPIAEPVATTSARAKPVHAGNGAPRPAPAGTAKPSAAPNPTPPRFTTPL